MALKQRCSGGNRTSTSTQTTHTRAKPTSLSVAEEPESESEHSTAASERSTAASESSTPRSASEEREEPPRSDRGPAIWMLCGAVIFCGAAGQAPFELLNNQDKGCSHLVSLIEHLFGIGLYWKALLRDRVLPMRFHVALALCSVGYTQFICAALGTSLPTTVLVTMKSGNLVANMMLGTMVLQKSYSWLQHLAVLCVTLGLVVAAHSGARLANADAAVAGSSSALLGALCIALALLSRAAQGVMQECWCRSYRVPVDELLAFRSLLGLPFVLGHCSTILHHAHLWSTSHEPVVVVPGLSFLGPWALLALNVLFDNCNRKCVSHLINDTSSLTANLVCTTQRFVSFVFSALLLSGASQTSAGMWFGAAAAFVGTFLYASAAHRPRAADPCPREKAA